MPSAKIMIVDDDLAMVMNLQELLPQNGYEVVGHCQSGEDALHMARGMHADLALVDIKLGRGMDGIELADQLLERFCIPSIFISGYADRELVNRAKKYRPLGYVLKPFSDKQLFASIELGLFASQTQNAPGVPCNELPGELLSRYTELTPTQLRVAFLIRQGKSSKEVADRLGISVSTVQWHRKHIRRKLQLTHTDKNLVSSLLF